MNDKDTIAAICSGVGSSITVIRISGPEALNIANCVWSAKKPLNRDSSRVFRLGRVLQSDKSPGEISFAVFMKAPGTFTGEDIAEIHAHGGSTNAKRLLKALIQAGARPAEAGEFTYRAFINGKIDLTQAEAVCDFISAHNETALELAERQMDGALGRKINEIRQTLINILLECEARVDFPEEELDFVSPEEHVELLYKMKNALETLYKTKFDGKILREGIRVVIAGKPNAGKSSLMNLLLGYDRAITTEIPGTTRDTLEEFVNIRGLPVKLIDTAGLRYSDDIIEAIGIQRTMDSLETSQIVIWMMDASSENPESEISAMKEYLKFSENIITVWNKTDLCQDISKLPETGHETLFLSVKSEKGIEGLLDIIEKKAWNHHNETPEVAISERHAQYIDKTLALISDAADKISIKEWEIAALLLKDMITYLGSITGQDPTIDIYHSIFSRFCIGK